MDPEQTQLLTKMLTSHTYRERLAIDRFRSALSLAPDDAAREDVRGAIEDEARHYAACLRVADSLGIELRPAVDRRMGMDPPGIPAFDNWLDFVLAHALNDRAGYHVLRGVLGSVCVEYTALCREIIGDEEGHAATGRERLLEYWPSEVGVRVPVEQAHRQLHVHLVAALQCCGRPGSDADARAVRLGLKSRSAERTSREFRKYAARLLDAVGLDGVSWLDLAAAALTPSRLRVGDAASG